MTESDPSMPLETLAGFSPALQSLVANWLERLEALHPGAIRRYRRLGGDPASLARLLACSDFAAGVLLRHWDWFERVVGDGTIGRRHERQHMASAFERELVSCDSDDEFKSRLRAMRQRAWLGVLWRDYVDACELDETLHALSDFADLAIEAAVEHGRHEIERRFGQVVDEAGRVPIVVLAMGKLGGRELNFSSDIDLVFLYPVDGESNGLRPQSAQEYFTRYARKIVALLEETTPDGFVFRVDTRLRPFGDSGAPVAGFAALEGYLVQHGRGWERYAYVKARVVSPAADCAVAAGLRHDIIEPFVYRRYLDYGVFESLREMHALVAAEVERRDLVDNIKLGPGGIREIEFIVQSLQLIRGGSVQGLRTFSLRSALDEAANQRELDRNDARTLHQAYRFLRRLENAIQALRDQQTHMLPESQLDRERVALALGCAGWDELASELSEHRRRVADQFAGIVFRRAADRDQGDSRQALSALWEQQADAAAWQPELQSLGLPDAAATASLLAAFARQPLTRRIDKTAARRLRQFIVNLVPGICTSIEPARTLGRVLHIAEQVLRRSAYLALLNENPGVLARLVDLCSRSSYLADEIARFPILLDELLDARLATRAPGQAEMSADLAERLALGDPADSEQQIELLAQFQRATLFRLAVADFGGVLPIMKVSDRLTELAELILGKALEIAWRDTVARFGAPTYVSGGRRRQAGLGIIGYGKLGGIELSYRSDLDIVFLHDSHGDQQETDAESPLENGMFFARLARRLVHFLTTQTGSGVLYEIDTRLRPSGRSGLLVTSLEAFGRYQEENAWTWEHQALLRSRPVAGSPLVGREFERIRAQTLRRGIRRDTLADEVVAMRARMRRELDRSDADRFDLKQGRGGIGDIEFLVQYLVLANAAEHPAVIHYTDNIRQLGTLAAAGCLPEPDCRRLQDVYKAYRTRLHRLALDGQPPFVPAGEFGDEREFVVATWAARLGEPDSVGSD